MERKALFFDIDGTLLTDDTKELPSSARAVIKKAREAGHLVFINSGRARCLLEEVESCMEADGFLCGCGTYIEIHGKLILHHLIRRDRRLELQRSIVAHDLEGVLEGPGGCYFRDTVSRMPEIERLKDLFFHYNTLYTAPWTEEALPFDKFCVIADEKSDLAGFLNSLKPDITPIDRGNCLYECVPTGFDKASAMKVVLEYFHIPWEQSYAFGDSSNDLAMIRYARNSIIMGKHSAVLEPYATFVTKNVEDDGIAYAFEKLHII